DHQCHLWGVATGRKVLQFPFPDHDEPRRMATKSFPSYFTAISPDHRLIAYGSQSRYLSLLELATGKEIATFANLPDGVCPLEFSPHGRTIAWGGWNDSPLY